MRAIVEMFNGIKQNMLMPFFTSRSPGSIGRILLLVTFSGIFSRFWMAALEPPASMVQTMYVLLAYIFGGKVLDIKNPLASLGPQAKPGTSAQAAAKPAGPATAQTVAASALVATATAAAIASTPGNDESAEGDIG